MSTITSLMIFSISLLLIKAFCNKKNTLFKCPLTVLKFHGLFSERRNLLTQRSSAIEKRLKNWQGSAVDCFRDMSVIRELGDNIMHDNCLAKFKPQNLNNNFSHIIFSISLVLKCPLRTGKAVLLAVLVTCR